MNTKFFCEFPLRGLCSRYVPDGSGRCEKHKGLVIKIKIKANRFRGKSRYAKSNGMFENAQE